MEFTVTEEFVREAHGASCSTWKQRIEKEFPDLFEKQFKEGEWYKRKSDMNNSYLIFHITSITKSGTAYGYGIDEDGKWFNVQNQNSNSCACNDYAIKTAEPATTEEVESALIAEAKKKGYVGKNIIMIEGLNGLPSYRKMSDKLSFEAGENRLICDCEEYGKYTIFLDGKWAEILPEQKTIITKGKALRIIAKKLKVSPESIEIQ